MLSQLVMPMMAVVAVMRPTMVVIPTVTITVPIAPIMRVTVAVCPRSITEVNRRRDHYCRRPIPIITPLRWAISRCLVIYRGLSDYNTRQRWQWQRKAEPEPYTCMGTGNRHQQNCR